MQLAIELLGPAVLSVATLLIARLVLPEPAGRRYPAAIALGCGFFVGYALLPSWDGFTPTRHWHWLPYLGVAAMVLGPLALANGVYAVERLLLFALFALVTALLLVPTWSDLEPSRPAYIGILSGYLFVLMAALGPLPDHLPGRLFLPMLAGVSACTAALVAAFVSLTYGQVAGAATAALIGCSVAARFETAAMLARGLVPGFVVIVGGCAFVGFIEPKPPLIGLLVAPAAPVALWTCAAGPLSQLGGWRGGVVQTCVLLIPLAVAAILVLMNEGG